MLVQIGIVDVLENVSNYITDNQVSAGLPAAIYPWFSPLKWPSSCNDVKKASLCPRPERRTGVLCALLGVRKCISHRRYPGYGWTDWG